MNLAKCLFENSQKNEFEFLIKVDETALKTSEFWQQVASAQQSLIKQGVKPKDCIALCNRRGVLFFIDMLAILSLDATAVLIDKEMSDKELSVILNTVEIASTVGLSWKGLKQIEVEYDISSNLVFRDVAADSIALILFTSGSTGKPKGVPLSHKILIGNIEATLEKHCIRSGDILGINIPFRFVSAISHFFSVFMTGASLVANENKLLPKDFLVFLLSNNVNAFGGAPLQLRTIAQGMKFNPQLKENLDWLMSSGDHLPVDVIQQIFSLAPEIKIVSAYGLTELGGRYFMNLLLRESLNKETLGTPIRGLTCVLRDESGEVVKTGEVGEVCLSGDWLFPGYLKHESSHEKLFKNGEFRTGDLGFVNTENELQITGRSQDVFKVSGLKVSSQLINSLLMKSKLFSDVAVVPYTDALLGTVPYLLYVSDKNISLNEVVQKIRYELEPHYFPKKIKKVDIIPRTGSGKIIRSKLSEYL